MKVGLTAVKSDRDAELSRGFDVIDQLKINVSPSASLLPLPSNVTVELRLRF